jgi:hypothetical protein
MNYFSSLFLFFFFLPGGVDEKSGENERGK